MFFEFVSVITNIEKIAVGVGVRDRQRLRKSYGPGRWRKLKGIATVRLKDSTECEAEFDWYEAHGIGTRELRIKKLLN